MWIWNISTYKKIRPEELLERDRRDRKTHQ